MAKPTQEKTPVAAEATKLTGGAVALQEQARGSTALTDMNYGDDAGKGMENLSKDEFKLPFIRILDPKSPQCKPTRNGGIGAKAGDIFNTATGEFYDGAGTETAPAKGIVFMPTSRAHNYVEFIPKNEDGSGGGFVGIKEPEDPLVLELRAKHGKFGKLPTDNATELSETFYLYGVIYPVEELDANGTPTKLSSPFRGVIGFASTQIPKYQTLMGRIDNIAYVKEEGAPPIKPPMWAHQWHLTTTYESKKTFSWYGWVIRLRTKKEGGAEDKTQFSLVGTKTPEYIMAKEFNAMINEGKVKVDFAKAADTEAGAVEPKEDEIPM